MSAQTGVADGEIRGRGLGRVFQIRLTKSRSLKETILRRELPRTRELRALQDVDVHVDPGEAFGIVGPNGSGKSTLLKLIAGIFAPTTGELEVGGRVGSMIELGAGFHPEFTGVENVYLNAAIYGLKRSYVDEHLDEIIRFAELEAFADVPVRAYSSGMYMRLGFSVAMHVNPNVLLLDEVLAVGDEAFQQKCFVKIGEFKQRGGTIVFVSHDAGRCRAGLRPRDHARGGTGSRGGSGGGGRARLPPPPRAQPCRDRRHAGRRLLRAVPRPRGARGGGRRRDPRPLHGGGADDARAAGSTRRRGSTVPASRSASATAAERRSAHRRSRTCGCARSDSSCSGSTSPGCRCARAASSSTSASRGPTAASWRSSSARSS